jgi:hypothetical protein
MLVEIINTVSIIFDYILKGIVSILLFIIGFIIHNPSMNMSTNDIHQFNNYVSYWFENIYELNAINELAYIIGWSFLYIIASIIAIIIICIIHTKIFKR